MPQNRYAKDYRLVETVNERGRIRTDVEYIGGPYRYAAGLNAAMRARRLCIALCAAGWLALVGGMLPNSEGMHRWYVSLPYIFAALPLGLLTDTLLFSAPRREPFERRQADRLQNRWPPAAIAAGLLPCVSLIADGVRMLSGGAANGADAVLCLCAALCAGCAWALFSLRRRLAPRKG